MTKLNLSGFDGVAFDFEGTLADTIPTHHASRMKAFRQHGFGHITEQQHRLGTTYGSSTFDILGGVLHAAGAVDNDVPFRENQVVLDVIKTKKELFRKAAEKGFDAMPGAINFVRALAPHFMGKMAVVTSSEEEFVLPFIERYGLGQYLPQEHIVGHESIETAGLEGKPSGDPYSLGMHRLNSQNLLAFEDTVSGVASAKKAGATVVALGFDAPSYELFKSGQLEYTPDIIATNYHEAAAALGVKL